MIKRSFLFFICCLCTHIAFAQNLIPNPSFEQMKLCPSWNNIDLKADHIEKFCESWENVGITKTLSCCGGGQYLNSCANIDRNLLYGSGIPINSAGYQEARTGNAYVFLRFSGHSIDYSSHFYNVKLKEPLVISKKYNLRFYLNLSDSSKSGINNIGMLLTSKKFFLPDDSDRSKEKLPNRAHLFAREVILDKENWVKVEGTIIADSSYEYLTIGNFFEFDKTSNSNPGVGWDLGYYIDDVSIELTGKQIEAQEQVACRGYSTTLLAKGEDESYFWSLNKTDTLNTSSSFVYSPRQTAYVYLVSTNTIDSMLISVVEPPIKVIPNEIEMCDETFITLNLAQEGASAYFVNNEPVDTSLLLSTPNTYHIKTLKGNCFRLDTFELKACSTTLFAPNAFTPNGDGLNDIFTLTGKQVYLFHLEVINKWGELVFKSNSLDVGWSGENVPNDTYFFIATYQNHDGTKQFVKKGLVNLLR